jgi:hypothetical protein
LVTWFQEFDEFEEEEVEETLDDIITAAEDEDEEDPGKLMGVSKWRHDFYINLKFVCHL